MKANLQPGKYVVAVSGGVDSVVLLDMLTNSLESRAESPQRGSSKLIVAHFDHGIRPDSADDRRFVQSLATHYGLPFVYGEGHLGPGASEAAARKARYDFLRKTRQAAGADAIITAHHQDDMLETAIINMIRGTGRLGLSSLKDQADIIRPLLSYTKRQLRAYALNHRLIWREDSTNSDTGLLRNHVRHNLLAKFSVVERQKLLEILTKASAVNQKLDEELAEILDNTGERLDRSVFNHLPHAAAKEVMAAWLRRSDIRDFDKKTLERLTIAAKTGQLGSKADVVKGRQISLTQRTIELV